jgi:hypothetical protein
MLMPFPWRRHFVRSAPPPSKRLSLEALEARTLLTISPSSLMVGTNVNIAQSTQQGQGQAETTIAIDPTDSTDSRLFAASNAAASASNHFAAYSTNGGVTWNPSDVSKIPTGRVDEQATFDQYGNLFLTYLDGNSEAVVAWSANGGKSFAGYKVLGPGDQPSVATGHGSVWVSYQDVGSTGSLHASGASVSGPLSSGGVVGTFSISQTVTGSSGGGSYGDIKVGPHGEVMVTYQDATNGQGPSNIYVNLNATGLGGTFGSAILVTSANVGQFATIPAQPSTINTIDAEANLAWNRDPSSPYFGRVYLVYTDRPSTSSTDTDTYVRYSDNDGTTWTAPVPVNNDVQADVTSQFNPAIAVDQSTGFVAVTWYDTRNSAGNNTAQIYGTVSADGVNWLPNVKIGAGLSNGVKAGNFNFGDYDTMDYANGVFYRSWADNTYPSLLSPRNANAKKGAMTPATARVTVMATGSAVTSGAGAFAAAAPSPAISVPSQSVISAGRNSESVDHLFTAAGKADQGGVWFRWTHSALDVGDLGGAGSDSTDVLAADEAFRALGDT